MNGLTEGAGGDFLPGLPKQARLPINRCNLPASILGSLRYQHSPAPLCIDGVRELHRGLFDMLDAIPAQPARARRFMDYMVVRFRLEALEDAGLPAEFGRLSPCRNRPPPRVRPNGNYLRALRGWTFDSDGREGAVLKGWVESRFGLLPRHHAGFLGEPGSEAHARYLEARSAGLYGTNALEAQFDLVYAYTQYELHRPEPERRHVTLYRGVNRLDAHERIAGQGPERGVFLLNNLNSFSGSRERAGEFGDYILETAVPLPKIFFHTRLLPGQMKAEEEFVVIGGLYALQISTF